MRIRALLPVLFAIGCSTPAPVAVTTTSSSAVVGLTAVAPQTVILVSIDGFRWDYLDTYEPPKLLQMARGGVRADALIPAFPTTTFPNHYSLVTGLFPNQHGIVSNTMYDPKRDAWFSMSDRAAVVDSSWWGGEPIWVTAERQGVRAATMFWPGSESAILGIRPSYWRPFDGDVSANDRVMQILEWLELPEAERPRFLTLYFEGVDSAGHRYGPDAPQTIGKILEVDAALTRLTQGIRQRRLENVNIVVVTDHGMAAVSADKIIVIDNYVSEEDGTIVDLSPVLTILPAPGREAAILQRLQEAPHLRAFTRDEVPAELHYGSNRRIPPIVAIADEGWTIVRRERFDPSKFGGGSHGYDNAHRSMHGLFVASGPAFRKGARVNALRVVDVYGLLCTVLGLQPARHEGALWIADDILVGTGRAGVPDVDTIGDNRGPIGGAMHRVMGLVAADEAGATLAPGSSEGAMGLGGPTALDTASPEIESEDDDGKVQFAETPPGTFSVAVASPASLEDATEVARPFRKAGHEVGIAPISVGSDRRYRVLLGPYADQMNADVVVEMIRPTVPRARIVQN